MHRDHKLGLALGVLVVGFAAALCFPKQGDIDQRLLQLENTADLDAEIARLPVHAYTNSEPAPPAEAATPVAEAEPAEIVPGGDDEWELLAGPPAPIATPVIESEPVTEDFDHGLQPTPQMATGDLTDSTPPATVQAVVPAGRRYTVRPGDTLSNLAVMFLGDHGAYLELFKANREVLATPDDLRPGMVLLIPGRASDADSPFERPEDVSPPKQSNATDAAVGDALPVENVGEAADVDQPAERKRLFRPAGSQPFLRTQSVSRRGAAPLPPMDASANSRGDQTSSTTPQVVQTYTVRRGDTLEGIAVKTYGDPRAVRDLLDANGDVVRDPRRLKPGTMLTLPERE